MRNAMGMMRSLDPFAATPPIGLSSRRLGERTCVIDLGTDLRHVDLPALDETVWNAIEDGCQDLVFDLGRLRRYEAFALVRASREWNQLAADGCVVHVAADDPRVVADLERLAGGAGWELHPSAADALSALLSAPVG
jgi:hypothetical protein